MVEMTILQYAEEILRMANDSEAIHKIKVCSWCGKNMPAGGEVGFYDRGAAIAYAFCNYDCLAQYNVSRGLDPDGSVPESLFSCPRCGGKHHESCFISYAPDFERAFRCLCCGHCFVRATWGQGWTV